MKRFLLFLLISTLLLTGCQKEAPGKEQQKTIDDIVPSYTNAVSITLDDSGILVDGAPISSDSNCNVYAANDIVYYPTGQDFTFGEGSEADAHEAAEAEKHTVVHITQPGTYSLSGKLSAGQIAVDLGEEAEDDPNAVVTLILDGIDITCSVAPAIIFYNVYECGDKDHASAIVDPTAAGANVYLTDGSENIVSGSYVARIYKPDSVELNEDGTEVLDAKKLHKYDAAFYSKMSMNIDGSNGILRILAENEGLDSELHLTINGGDIHIRSGNDGINTNEDGISVTTINGGSLTITVTGETGEGDGIDSNGWLVINGGTVTAAACSFSGDAGIDSDMGTSLHGGTVIATGNMLDQIGESSQTYAVFTFAQPQTGGNNYELKNADSGNVLAFSPVNDFSYLIISGDFLAPGDYTLHCGDTQLAIASAQEFMGLGNQPMMPGSETPENLKRPEGTAPEDMQFPEGGMTPPKQGELPENEMLEGMTPPDGTDVPEGKMPQTAPNMQEKPDVDRGQMMQPEALSNVFPITNGANSFSVFSSVN